MSGLFCGFVLLYLIKFTGAPWWLYLILVPAMVVDALLFAYEVGKENRNGDRSH